MWLMFFREDSVATLMCFVFSCKELAITGYDMFGEQVQKGKILYRTNKAQVLHIIAGDVDEAAEESWRFNMSAKYYKDRFGAAVARDPGMQTDSTEWFRHVRRQGGRSGPVLPGRCGERKGLPA